MTSTLKIGIVTSLAFHTLVSVGFLLSVQRSPIFIAGHESRGVRITILSDDLFNPTPEPPTEPPRAGVPVAALPQIIPLPEQRSETPKPDASFPEIRVQPQAVREFPSELTRTNQIMALAVPAPLKPLNVATQNSVALSAVPGPQLPRMIDAIPIYRKNPEPVYPPTARRRRQEGVVIFSVSVSSSGRPTHLRVKQSSGFAALDEAASAAVKYWEFEPARVGPLSVDSEVEVPIRFQLTR